MSIFFEECDFYIFKFRILITFVIFTFFIVYVSKNIFFPYDSARQEYKASNFARCTSSRVVERFSRARIKREILPHGGENKRALSFTVTLNQLDRSSLTAGGGRVLPPQHFILQPGYLDSSAHESLRSNRPLPQTHSYSLLFTRHPFSRAKASRILAIRDTVVGLWLARYPRPTRV